MATRLVGGTREAGSGGRGWAAEDARDRAETAALAAAGDEPAKERMERFMHLDMLASVIRRWRRRNAHRGAPQMRPAKDVDATLNPSRSSRSRSAD